MPSLKSKTYVIQEAPMSTLPVPSFEGTQSGTMSPTTKSPGKAGFGRRLALLLWKNLLLRRRHWIVTLAEILLPTLIALFIAAARTKIVDDNKTVSNETTIFQIQGEDEILSETRRSLFRKKTFMAYVPQNNLTREIMMTLASRLKAKRMELKGFDTETELEIFNEESELASAKYSVQQVKAAIVFGKLFHGGKLEEVKGSRIIDYKIRIPTYTIETKGIFPWIQFAGPSDDNAYSYVNGGFTGLQVLMDKLLIEILTGHTVSQELKHQVFPYPPYTRTKGFDQGAAIMIPLFMIFGFIFIVPSIIIKIVSERETGIKELMKIMGLPNYIHWLGWMINSVLVLIVSISIVVFLFCYTFNPETGPVLPYSNPLIWWLILFFYIIAATSYCFFISVLSDRATTATAIGIVSWLVLYLMVAIPMEQNFESVTLEQKLATCLFPNMALHWAIKAIFSFETRGVGANWQTFFLPTSPLDGFALYHVLIMLALDTILLVTLTIYLENILPSKYGLRKPWYYIFQSSTWFPRTEDPKVKENRRASLASPIERPGFEKEPIGLPVGVAIQNLRKVFGKKRAVDGVSLKMYEGQITALLGHNGAGKTTMLSIITGLIPPTSGTASVNDYDIRTEMDKVRESLGLCPQHNMLFDKLTVMEHLLLFGRLKGLSAQDALYESRNLIKKLHLREKTHYMSSELSGGQKRKLSLGIALIGGSKVVILDECTSGMDPEARRELRGERTIILTTHFMEEADILGDRIAMMGSGKIKCCGTALYLKKYYGAGYTLKLTTDGGRKGNEKIVEMVQTFIPKAVLASESLQNGHRNGGHSNGAVEDASKSNPQGEISINLPNEETTLQVFPSLFQKMNEEKESLGIITMGLQLSTMDDVFLKIGEMEAHENGALDLSEEDDTALKPKLTNDNNKQNWNYTENGNGVKEFVGSMGQKNPKDLLNHQLFGLFQKKYNYTLRNKMLLLSQFVVPPILLIAAIFLSTRVYIPGTTSPALRLNISQFHKATTFFSSRDEELGHIYAENVGPQANPTYLDPSKISVIEGLLEAANEDLGRYRDEYLVAADIQNDSITAMYNSIPYHSAPISMNLVTNTLLKSISPNYSVETSYHPLENQLFATLQSVQPSAAFTLLVPVAFGALVPIGLALFSASYAVFPTDERLSNSKQLQLMSGVSSLTFWGTSFIWDFFVMTIAILVMLVCFPLFERAGSFTANGGLVSILGILLIYGYSAISFSYLFSLIAPSSSSAFACVTIIHVIFGMIFPIFVFFTDNLNYTVAFMPLRWVGRIFSSFGGSMSIMRYAAIATANSRCSLLSQRDLEIICNPQYQVDATIRQCCPNCLEFSNEELQSDVAPCFIPDKFIQMTYNYTSFTDAKKYTIPGIGDELIYVVIAAFVYQFLILLFESGIARRVSQGVSSLLGSGTSQALSAMEKAEGLVVDPDVAQESKRVHGMNTRSEDALVVTDLSKNFQSFAAVREINFGVHYGECFGLLGVNGAGKTTTFKMLTGDEDLSTGNAYAYNKSLNSEKKEFLAKIGYCPQFDAIIDSLSGREMLTLFCHLRGVPFEMTQKEVDKWLHKLGLEKSGDVPCGSYSGGMKRRLSVGISMIGDPPIVLLDEPTSGVDPVSRRQFWDVIAAAKASGQSVILTSHSMDEIQVLCSRLGIMVNGRFQCLGSVEYLRNKFAHGYTLVLKLKHHHHHDSPIIAHLKNDILAKFQPCVLQDEHQNILQFQLNDSSTPWDVIFRNMEEIKKKRIPAVPEVLTDDLMRRNSLKYVLSDQESTYESLIEDYTVSLTSLEEVFLSFARKQYMVGRNANTSCFTTVLRCKCCDSEV